MMIQQRAAMKDGIYEMTLDHLEDVKEMMACSFLEKNEIWSSFSIQKEDILEFFDRLIRGHLASQERSKKLYGDNICHSMVLPPSFRSMSSTEESSASSCTMSLRTIVYCRKMQNLRSLSYSGSWRRKGRN